MMRKLQFKNIDLIKLVEQRPLLWDRSCVLYNKLSKDKAWLEICWQLYPNFETFSIREQQVIAAEVTAKWRNLRDAFVRSVRRKRSFDQNGQAIKTYVYYDHLQFLLQRKKRPGDNTVSQSNIDESSSVIESAEDDIPMIGNDIEAYDSVQSSSLSHEMEFDPSQLLEIRRHEAQIQQQQQQQILQQSQHFQQEQQESTHQLSQHHYKNTIDLHQEFAQIPDEDVSFFVSIIPSVRNLSEDEKLEFRIGALELLRKLKRNRRAQQNMNRPMGQVKQENNLE